MRSVSSLCPIDHEKAGGHRRGSYRPVGWMPLVGDPQPLPARADLPGKACQLLDKTIQTRRGGRFGARARADGGGGSALFDESTHPGGWGASKVMAVDLGQAANRDAIAVNPAGEGVRIEGCRSMGFNLPWPRCQRRGAFLDCRARR